MAVYRYSELNTTNRTDLFLYGWKIFVDNPLIGVGTGNYYTVVNSREFLGSKSGAHNELTRAVAEHGIVGLVVWLWFLWAAFRDSYSVALGDTRPLRVALILFAFLGMFYNGLKLIIQPMLILVALTAFTTDRRQYVVPPFADNRKKRKLTSEVLLR
jgi:O-antigen ligase